MNGHSSPTTRRFVRAAWLLLAFQLVAAAGATGLAVWAAWRVQLAIDDRDAMAQRVRELETRPPVAPEPKASNPVVDGETEAPAEPGAEPTPRPIVRPPVRPGQHPVEPPGHPPPPPPPPPPTPVRREAEIIGRDLQPPYPAVEIRAQRSGTVRVRVTVSPNGQVTAVERLQATSDAFWRATERQAHSRWRFRPATLDGRPIEATKVITVTFRIEDN